MNNTLNEIFARISGGRCEVLGLGVSNIPLCRWLRERGATVIGRDMKPEAQLDAAAELRTLGVTLITGEDYLEDIGGDVPERTLIFRAPGLRHDLPQIASAVSRGAVLTSEMELFLELTPATVIGITGSDGKTTTTTITGKLLEAQFALDGSGRRVYVGGNIGRPLLPLVDEMTDRDFAVVELSSFQLMTARRSAHRAAITNITPNHLNWHTGMDEYILAKQNIYLYEPCEYVVFNAENKATACLAREAFLDVTLFSSKRKLDRGVYLDGGAICLDGERILDTSRIILPGMHNIENYMTAIALTRGIVSREAIITVAESFTGVEHRCELVREKDGVKFYNSSIDSSPTRTAAALSNFKVKPIVICGGYDKNIPFEPLAVSLCERAKAVVLTGDTAEKIKSAIIACPSFAGSELAVYEDQDFEGAVKKAADLADDGDCVLLSPACASFDRFKNFEERGRVFKSIVNNL
ncbi:MAG: UDP-N-acetylmuramoyl-L-alanine--D-glutamate ligase [Clostridia bacterium]|nr:UDP-N-acetylmuramoyl-L-alanine--D-glutamate ligase [Clostridia bacterium]